MLAPTMAVAAPQDVTSKSPQSMTMVSPQVESRYVSTTQYYSDPMFAPYSYYYSDGFGYSGWLYQTSVYQLGSLYAVNYSGFVYKY
jgi:hypothetical protein